MLAKINGQGFSATAYYFARDMRAANGRPLGVIQSAWGGTRAEAWTSLSGLKQEPALAHYVTAYEKNVKDNPLPFLITHATQATNTTRNAIVARFLSGVTATS